MAEQLYFVRKRGEITGPFSVAQLQSLHARGQFGRFNEVSLDRVNWQAAASVDVLFRATTLARESPAVEVAELLDASESPAVEVAELVHPSDAPPQPASRRSDRADGAGRHNNGPRAGGAGFSARRFWLLLCVFAAPLLGLELIAIFLILAVRAGDDASKAVLYGFLAFIVFIVAGCGTALFIVVYRSQKR